MPQKFGLYMAGKVLETYLKFMLDRLPSRRPFGVDHLRIRASSAHNKCLYSALGVDIMYDVTIIPLPQGVNAFRIRSSSRIFLQLKILDDRYPCEEVIIEWDSWLQYGCSI